MRETTTQTPRGERRHSESKLFFIELTEERQTRAQFEDEQHPDDEEAAAEAQPWEMPGELEQLPERVPLALPEHDAEDVEIITDDEPEEWR